MRETLEALARGEMTVSEAEASLAGYATTESGRFDAARESRRGVPEAVLGEGKTPTEAADLASTSLETTGRTIVTRVDEETAAVVHERLETDHPDADITLHERARVVVGYAADYEPLSLDARVDVVAAGTSDAEAAGEAAVIASEMGADVNRVADVGVAGINRLFDRMEELRDADVLIVAAGREGALPTVVAGLVDTPVIGLPVSTGYGHAGAGEAALSGMIQSCTVLSVVNIDAGFTAGAQAGLIARAVDQARNE